MRNNLAIVYDMLTKNIEKVKQAIPTNLRREK